MFKVLLFLISSGILALILPSYQTYSETTIRKFTHWPYNDLIASDDFYFKKNESELKQEQQWLIEQAPLFFKVNESEKNQKLEKLDKMLADKNQISEISTIKNIIDTVFQVGIIEKIDNKKSGQPLFIVQDGYASQFIYSSYFTIESALELFDQKVIKAPDKNTLRSRFIDLLAITVYFDKELTLKAESESLNSISIYKSSVAKGQKIVSSNELIDDNKKELILSYLHQTGKNHEGNIFVRAGNLMISFLLFGILMLYLAFFRKNIFGQNKQITFIFLSVIVAAITSKIVSSYGVLFFWSLPFALIPVLVRVFFDSRTALFTFLITILFCSAFANDKYKFMFVQLAVGMGTVFSVAEMKNRKDLLSSVVVVFLFCFFTYIGFTLASGNYMLVLQKIQYLPLIISSLLVLLAYPFIFIAEKVFGFVSDFTLMEISNLNAPLLRELSLKVPGTFQHSLQVANLAEEAVFHIGGNSLLIRAGAMYHDIGKIDNPRYFTENQVGEVNPHADILPEESAKIIISHVIKGIEKAKEHNIPEAVIDFIRTHHGTTTAGFFLHNFKKEHKDENVNEDMFRYPGPIPFSKETAVLMMADGVEAASRSLKKYDALAINELVDRIIDYKISENQFINAEITFKDITIVKKIFKKRLMNMYHVRIEYPR